jgi:hypothetical protein
MAMLGHHTCGKKSAYILNSIDDKIYYNPAQLNALKHYQQGFLNQ